MARIIGETHSPFDPIVSTSVDAVSNWRTTPARGRIVARAARLLEEHQEELAQILTREEGKTIAESRGECNVRSTSRTSARESLA